MGNLLKATIGIKGIRPILWHHFGPDALPLEKQEKTGVAGNNPGEWRKSLLMTANRQLYLEPTYIFGCVRDAARYTKKGKGSLQAVVSATLQVLDERILIDRFLPEEPIPTDPQEPVYLDVRSVRNPSTRARNVRYRIGASPGWRASFTLLWDKTIVSRNEMQAILNDAGQLVGLADGRSIGFGRFTIENFEVTDA
ncbi:MAG: hypothetical protein M3R24_39765 [Chloroflexota bacterium]|nr:hypothetical protein [Chloroflexota bacterium]